MDIPAGFWTVERARRVLGSGLPSLWMRPASPALDSPGDDVPALPVPPQVDAFLAQPNPAVISVLRPDGSPLSVATWYAWEDRRVLVNMDETRRRLAYMQNDPRVSLTVLEPQRWSHVSLRGRVASMHPDVDLVDIDRLSWRYGGEPYPVRDRPRVSAWIEVQSWYGWGPHDV